MIPSGYGDFAEGVRKFALSECPPDIRKLVSENVKMSREPWSRWQKILHARGWGAPNWPKEHGGTGWNEIQCHIFDAVLSECDCPLPYHQGLKHIGPVIIQFGSEAQKRRYLPGILDGSEWWCQGYSEPNAGSDLASLTTSAQRAGDHYLVNGQKTWTSHAHESDYIYALVRTSVEEKRQKGISLLLISLRTPGITTRPIRTIDKLHHVNEVFFDNVEVPIANRIGEEGSAWQYGKFLLDRERLGVANTAPLFQLLKRSQDLLERQGDKRDPKRREAYAERLLNIEAQLIGLRSQGNEVLARAMRNEQIAVDASSMKVTASHIVQDITETAFDIISSSTSSSDDQDFSNQRWVETYFYNRAATIFGGSDEVQKNIISRWIFGD